MWKYFALASKPQLIGYPEENGKARKRTG